MNRANPLTRREALSLLALAASLPMAGCGEEPAKVAPPETKGTNDDMENFMKTQKKK